VKSTPVSAQIDLPPLALRADVRPDSVNAEQRTAEVVFSTGAPVSRFDWGTGQRYTETLSLKPKDIRLDRLNDGAPFLNAHSAFDLSDVLGVVVSKSARVVDGQAIATIRFSKRDTVEPIWRDVQDGIIRNVSVGYRVHKYEQTDAADARPAIRHAVDWEPYEISAVPMPADNGAKVRADSTQTNPCVLVTRAPEETMAMDETTQTPPAESPDILDPARHVPAAIVARAVAVEPVEVDVTEAAADRERARITGIINGCEAARLPMAHARKLIAAKVTLEQAQTEILNTLRNGGGDERGPRGGGSGVQMVGADPLENVWRGIGNALLHKVMPSHYALEDIGRPYRARTLMSTGEMCLMQRGIRTADLSKMELAGLCLGLNTRGGLHTTSDFVNILADVANKTLRKAYEVAPQTFLPVGRRISITDFKPLKRNQIGDAPALLKVLEHGEFTRGTIGEGKEQITLATWGRVFGITRQALINDDLDAFSRLTVMFGRSARNMEADQFWAEFINNAVMSDGIPLFHASHNNLSAVNDVISIVSIGRAAAAMRKQKSLDGVTPINVTPLYLIVPPSLEVLARQFVSVNMQAATSGTINPFAGQLTVIVEPRLEAASATAWYITANPDQIDTVEYGFLDGEDGPVVESRVGFDVDGLEVKCREDFAAKAIDYRGLYKNIGA
jgi:hypothetical protein